MTYHRDLDAFHREADEAKTEKERLREELARIDSQIVTAEQKLDGLRTARRAIKRKLEVLGL